MPDPLRLFDRLNVRWSAFILSCVALCSAPFFKEDFDVISCWLKWSATSKGIYPWAIYAANSDCNYPAFVPYLLTASQALINLLHAGQNSPLAILLVKVPNLIACLAGAWICLTGLKPIVGKKSATAVATVYVLCLPLWYNAAIWGQWDALSSLAMVAALLAVANSRPFLAGSAVGWALSIKLHAIVILPAIFIYAVRRWSLAKIGTALAAAVLAWCVIAAPYFINGQGTAVMKSYTGAVNFYPGLSEGAFNGWQLLHFYNLDVRHLTEPDAGYDGQRLIGSLTARQLGLLLFAVYTIWLAIGLAKTPSRLNLFATAGLTAVAFFMLPTQVHQRYLVPAAAIFTLVAYAGYGWTYLLVMLAALINQWVVLEYERRDIANSISSSDQHLFMRIYCILSIVNLIGFVWITWHHHRRLRKQSDADFSPTAPPLAA